MQSPLCLEFQEKLARIGDYFLNDYKKDFRQNTYSFMGGRAGTILLQSLLLKATNDQRFKEQIDEGIEFVINRIETVPEVLPTFCTGLAGFGWLMIYLNEQGIIDIDVDTFLTDLDEALEEELQKMISEDNYDIMHGAMGLGLYFLKRKKYAPVESIINALNATSEAIGTERLWRRYDKHRTGEYIYDFGLAHGIASILYFLSKCYEKGLQPSLCLELIQGGVVFFKNNIQHEASVGSFFPASKLVRDYKVADRDVYCRLAWCYGDLGILHTLFVVGSIIKDETITGMALEMLEEVSKRRDLEKAQVKDAGFCHGASGIGYLFLNLYHRTGNRQFAEAADYWAEKTLSLGYHKEGIHGYLFHMGNAQWQVMSDILTGLGGVGAFYLQYLYKDLNSDWNECFYLS